MLPPEQRDQTILQIAQGEYVALAAESFLTDRRAAGLAGQSQTTDFT